MAGSIGFIGLGQMGSRMAGRLAQSGADLIVQDVDADAVERLTGQGAVAAATPVDVAARASIVLCSLPTPDIVEAVIFGQHGLIEGDAVEIIVDLSTTGATRIVAFAERLQQRGIALVDAPVSGGIDGAAAGTLSIMVSGRTDALARVDAILRLLGSRIFVMGDAPGLGQRMKLVNNMLVAANAMAAFETLVLGAQAGLDPALMIGVINASSGRSFITTDKIPQCVLPGSFPARFAADLLYKDVRLGIDEAAADGVRLSMMETALGLMTEAIADGDPKADYAALIRYFERRAGAEVRAAAS